MNKHPTQQLVESIETVVAEVQEGVERELQPVRASILKRYQTIFFW